MPLLSLPLPCLPLPLSPSLPLCRITFSLLELDCRNFYRGKCEGGCPCLCLPLQLPLPPHAFLAFALPSYLAFLPSFPLVCCTHHPPLPCLLQCSCLRGSPGTQHVPKVETERVQLPREALMEARLVGTSASCQTRSGASSSVSDSDSAERAIGRGHQSRHQHLRVAG